MNPAPIFLPTRNRSSIVRLIAAGLCAALVTATLLWVMQYLIASADRRLDDARKGSVLEFVRLKREEVIERRQIRPKKPPPPKTPREPSEHAATCDLASVKSPKSVAFPVVAIVM